MGSESQDRPKNSVVMQSALSSHEGELVWSISELSQLKNSSIVSNEFSIDPCCKVTWEIQLYLTNDVGTTNIKIKRKVLFRESCTATIRCSFENSKGEAYNFLQETFHGNDLILTIPCVFQKDVWNFTECSHDDVLIVKCQIKLKNCCIVTKTIEKGDTYKTILPKGDLSINLIKGFASLYKRNLLTDVEIKVGKTSYRAHKIILCIRSPVFLNMFESDMIKRGTRVIKIEDAQPKIVEAFLSFLYTDTIGELSIEEIRELYAVAHKFKVSLLQDKCSSVLLVNLNDDTVCKTLKMADSYKEDALKEAASNYIKVNLSSIQHTPEFKSLRKNHPGVVLDILLGGLTATTATSGMAIKFNPPTLRDTMIKGGVQCNIVTRCQCITSMEEYKNKSLEELRVEYYAAALKGGAGGIAGATNPFGGIAAATNSAKQSIPTFGTTFATNNTPQSSWFNAPNQAHASSGFLPIQGNF